MGPDLNNMDLDNVYYEEGGAVELPMDPSTGSGQAATDVEIEGDDGPTVDMTDDLSAWV